MPIYSHSRLGTFQQCKYRFKLKYINKIKVDIPDTIETFLGGLVHEVMKKLYSDLMHQKLNSKEQLVKLFLEKWEGKWSDKILMVKKEYTKKNYRDMGVKFISDYYDHYKPFSSTRTIGLETEYTFLLENGNRYHIRIDRLSCDSDGNYYINDYKTNSKLKPQEELDEDRQLAMYSLWVKKNFKDARKVKLVWYFLAFDKEMISERSDEQLSQLKKDTEQLIREIEKCKKYPTNVSSLCDWCEYKPQCPAWKHEFELKEKSPKEFKEDDGLKMVDSYAKIKEKISSLDVELDELKEKLIQFSKQKDIEAVYGTKNRISVKSFESISFPAKAERDELNKLIKSKGLWDELSELDTHKLSKMVKNDELPDKLKKDIKKFITKVESYRLSLGKK